MPHRHHKFLYLLHNRELNELYVSIAIRAFALSLIGLFIPIFLLTAGYSLTLTLIFFAATTITHVIFTFPAAKIASRFGFKHAILFSSPILILAHLGLYGLDVFQWLFYPTAIFFGISSALFWIGYHVDFAKFSDKKRRGREVGFSRVVSILFYSAGPVIGGSLILIVGFKVIFLAVSILLMASAIPLFMSKDIHSQTKLSLKGTFKKRSIKDTLAIAGFGAERAAYVLWIIFIFFTVLGEQYTLLGSVVSLSLLLGAIFIFIIGKFSDSYRRLVLRVGAISNALVWFFKSLVSTGPQVFLVDAFYGATQSMMLVPFDAISYDKANKQGIIRYLIYREMVLNTARFMVLIAMIFVADISAGFIFGGSLGSLLQLLF